MYGTPGGAVTLAEHGVTFAGPLPASKARIALALGLAADLDRDGEAGDTDADALADLFRTPQGKNRPA